ncbi:MAG: hypothetical protein WB919_03840 [Candidatus Sulfotelmatobacter sp.]
MLLVHDIGEIDAGNTFVFAQDGWEARKEQSFEPASGSRPCVL